MSCILVSKVLHPCTQHNLVQTKVCGGQTTDTRIHKDRISSHSIRLPGLSSMPLLPSMSMMGFGGGGESVSNAGSAGSSADTAGEEGWTRACRAVLQVLKRILVVESEGERGRR